MATTENLVVQGEASESDEDEVRSIKDKVQKLILIGKFPGYHKLQTRCYNCRW